jgi:hypothetical protein
MAPLSADPIRTYQFCEGVLAEAFVLVPQLPAIATTRSGPDGLFSCDKVTAGKQYQVIGIKYDQDQRPIVIPAKTERLRPGQELSLELSENAPWTGPVFLK